MIKNSFLLITILIFIGCSQEQEKPLVKLSCQAEKAHMIKSAIDNKELNIWADRETLEEVNKPHKNTPLSLPLDVFNVEFDRNDDYIFKVDDRKGILNLNEENNIGWITTQYREEPGIVSINYITVNLQKRNFKIEISKPIEESDEMNNYGFSNKLEIYGILYGDCQKFS